MAGATGPNCCFRKLTRDELRSAGKRNACCAVCDRTLPVLQSPRLPEASGRRRSRVISAFIPQKRSRLLNAIQRALMRDAEQARPQRLLPGWRGLRRRSLSLQATRSTRHQSPEYRPDLLAPCGPRRISPPDIRRSGYAWLRAQRLPGGNSDPVPPAG